jgi:hypothetical protein
MPPEPPRTPIRERLGTYLLGVAIGCMIVGFIFYGRYQEKQRRAAVEAAQQSEQPQPH